EPRRAGGAPGTADGSRQILGKLPSLVCARLDLVRSESRLELGRFVALAATCRLPVWPVREEVRWLRSSDRSISRSQRREKAMFASIRRYRTREGSMDELARRVDVGFAEEICARPGFVSYEFIDCGDGEVMTISIFRE